MLEEECEEIDRLQAMHDTHGEHKKLIEATGVYITEYKDKRDLRKTYIQNLLTIRNHSLETTIQTYFRLPIQ